MTRPILQTIGHAQLGRERQRAGEIVSDADPIQR
jgi:hypothetical protein